MNSNEALMDHLSPKPSVFWEWLAKGEKTHFKEQECPMSACIAESIRLWLYIDVDYTSDRSKFGRCLTTSMLKWFWKGRFEVASIWYLEWEFAMHFVQLYFVACQDPQLCYKWFEVLFEGLGNDDKVPCPRAHSPQQGFDQKASIV